MKAKKKERTEIIKKFSHHEKDTGSSEVQIALLTERIDDLGEHFKVHKKDNHSRRGLLEMVNRRRKLLDYLKKVNKEKYAKVIKELKLRR